MRASALLLLLLLLLAAGPGWAESPVFDPAPIAACIEAGGGADCIGEAATACMEASPGGYSTVMMNGCLDAELGWWDDLLNARFQLAVAAARDLDAEATRAGSGRPSSEAALRGMQRAWIAFRDAACEYEALDWWGGTGASGAYL